MLFCQNSLPDDPIEHVETLVVGELPYSFNIPFLGLIGQSIHENVLLFLTFRKSFSEIWAVHHIFV